jgi:hypothetical protein
MEKAYIVLVHRNPEQVYRLIKRLDDGHSTFFVHIDKKVKLSNFDSLANFQDKVQYVKREDGKWGGFGIVQATLNGMEAVQSSGIAYRRISLISGQDYPLKSNRHLDEVLKTAEKSVFVQTFGPLPIAHWKEGGLVRIQRYFFGLKPYQIYLAKGINFPVRKLPFLRKKAPYGLTIYGGSQWWTMDAYALTYVLDYIRTHPKLKAFFKYALLSDEMFFQTILGNAKDPELLKRIENNNKRFLTIPKGKQHPLTIVKADLPNLLASDAFFARKFNPDEDAEIFDLLDAACLASDAPAQRV